MSHEFWPVYEAVLGEGSCMRRTKRYSCVFNTIDIVSKYNIDIHSVQKVWALPLYRQPVPILYGHSPFINFFRTPHLLQHFLDNIINYIRHKHKDKLMRTSYLFLFRRLQNKVTFFFYTLQFYMPYLAQIWFEIITASSIKRIWKQNRHCKWKTWCVKIITTTKSIRH